VPDLRIPAVEVLRRYWFAMFVLASLIYVVLFVLQQAPLVDRSLRFSSTAIVVTGVVQGLFWLLASALWRRLVQHSTGRAIGLLESFGQLCIVNLGKYLPGKVWGMVARGSRLRDRHEVPLEHALRATALEQFFLLYAAAVVVLIGSRPFLAGPWAWLAVAMAGLAVILVVPVARLMMRWISWIGDRFAHGHAVRIASTQLGRLDHYRYLLGYLGIWLLLGGVLCGLAISFFPLSLSWSLFAVALVAATAGYVAGFLAVFAPGGVGVREVVVSAVLATAMPVSDAVALSLLFRLWTVVLEGVAGPSALLLTRRLRPIVP